MSERLKVKGTSGNLGAVKNEVWYSLLRCATVGIQATCLPQYDGSGLGHSHMYGSAGYRAKGTDY